MGFSFSKQSLALVFIFFSLSFLMELRFIHGVITTPITNTQFIKTSCSSTTYPRLCFSSLSIHASSIQTSPRLLAATALTVSLSSVKSTTLQVLKLSQTHGVPLRDVAASKDCLEQLGDAVDSISNSIKEMGKLRGSNFDLTMSNIQTWVSAALTDETTCSEGFQGKVVVNGGDAKTIVRNRIVNIAQLTSNALALINHIADLHR